MNSKSLEIKLKKNAKNRGLILRKAKNSPNTLQIISVFIFRNSDDSGDSKD